MDQSHLDTSVQNLKESLHSFPQLFLRTIVTSHYCQDIFPTYSFYRLILFLCGQISCFSMLYEKGLGVQWISGMGFGTVMYNLLCQRLNLKAR